MNKMLVQILIENEGKFYYPAVLDGVEWETIRSGAPGKLTFKVLKDEVLDFQEGNSVKLTVNGVDVFFGIVFTKQRDKNNIITVTAYDQLRYLKNKHVYVYEGLTASQVIVNLAKQFQLKVGEIEDTEYVIPRRVEDNKTLFDMMLDALDLTLINSKKMYVLYDNLGELTLKNIESMKLNLVIDAETAENFNYASSINDKTYNRVVLCRNAADEKEREIYIAPQDQHEFSASENIKKWGVLQYFDDINTEAVNPQATANALLELYNHKTRTLSIDNAFGDIRVRAGTSIIVKLDLGDISLSNYMLVERVKHVFNNCEHFMSFSLRGGEINE